MSASVGVSASASVGVSASASVDDVGASADAGPDAGVDVGVSMGVSASMGAGPCVGASASVDVGTSEVVCVRPSEDVGVGVGVSGSVYMGLGVGVGVGASCEREVGRERDVGVGASVDVGVNVSVDVGVNVSASVGVGTSLIVGVGASMSVDVGVGVDKCPKQGTVAGRSHPRLCSYFVFVWQPLCTCAAASRLAHARSLHIEVHAPRNPQPAHAPPFARLSALTALGSALCCIRCRPSLTFKKWINQRKRAIKHQVRDGVVGALSQPCPSVLFPP